ncbi:coniferyl aldehyde dehydrogenase [Aurantiacibacter sp. D1-12]|uniref:coniferyl aldehyde dehydrogenase n=1 Tax=Aurantiacibacter sp. D1-12 TaxID=2993658 RepID=UPI00237CFB62|nr:coniferyl aldehyde dehydrogenase [Aurantiacibacter sp. D1-12]MDE1466609.1 coniferyl aldehyde dehydrogenase [Aurantiacibacter sp. D1-12]
MPTKKPTQQWLTELLDAQRAAFVAARPEPLSVRQDRLDRLLSLLTENDAALCDAMNEDYGNRSEVQSMITDVMAAITFTKYCKSNLRRWASPERRSVQFPLGLVGAKAELRFEPKGVIGIISPWNFPVNLAFGPLAQVLAAGNRAMIKPSEFTPVTSNLIAELVAQYFSEDEVTVANGGVEVAQAFSSLPFDHLVFTGSTEVGRHVMRAAAENLVPVTLELGGKSPTVIGRSADLEQAGSRIVTGKMMNAGQICLAPDYLLVPEEMEDGMIAALELGAMDQYPALRDNPDYASVINDKQFARLQEMVADAREKGGDVIEINPADEDFSAGNQRKMPLTVIRNPSDDMQAMREEIFGPVLPVLTYSHIDEAIERINGRDRPLGLYYFGEDVGEREKVLKQTISGGVTVNDVIFHISAEDMPFGGIGPSGMGCYHGPEGFKEFSHARSVYTQPKLDVAALGGLKPPYGARAKKLLSFMARK